MREDSPQASPRRQLSASPLGLDSILGESPPIREAVDFARRIAMRRDAPILITGETGTGKGFFARAIHCESPIEDGEPFVPVNCAGLPETLLEAELLGFAGEGSERTSCKVGLLELAGRGTLFLNDVSTLPMGLQARLARVLETRRARRVGGEEDREIQCRIIASTNRPLDALVAQGRFRQDLYDSLAVFNLHIPPLRERGRDLEILSRHFLERVALVEQRPVQRLTPDAYRALHQHRWPGNVRELRYTLERASFQAPAETIDADHLTIQIRWNRPVLAPDLGGSWEMADAIRIPPEGKALEEIEKEAVEATLALTRGNQSAAARILGISRPTLSRKILRYGLRIRRYPVD